MVHKEIFDSIIHINSSSIMEESGCHSLQNAKMIIDSHKFVAITSSVAFVELGELTYALTTSALAQ